MMVRRPSIKQVSGSLLQRAARAAGYEVIPSWRFDHLGLATHLRDLFARLAVDCVLDVGANRGQYGRFLRAEVGYAGQIVSFEPQSAALRELETRARSDSLWKVFGLALGAASGQLPLNVMEESAFTSFLAPDPSAVPTLAHLNSVVQVETVQVKRLDDMIDEIKGVCDSHNFYLKLDTQGYDLEVLRGATATLGSIAALQTEVSVLPIYRHMPNWLTSLQVLKEYSFDVTGLYPVSQDPNLRVVEFDCVAINAAFRRPGDLSKPPTTPAPG
jgi:FkbM family methyltransferase